MSGSVQVLFEGIRAGGEFWGGTQADFLLVPQSGARREVCIVLSDAAATAMAEEQSTENTDQFRSAAAHSVGTRFLQAALASNKPLAPTMLVTADMVAGSSG